MEAERAANGTYKSAGTYDSHERAYEIAAKEERHARCFLGGYEPGRQGPFRR
jgi:hypothetical protein